MWVDDYYVNQIRSKVQINGKTCKGWTGSFAEIDSKLSLKQQARRVICHVPSPPHLNYPGDSQTLMLNKLRAEGLYLTPPSSRPPSRHGLMPYATGEFELVKARSMQCWQARLPVFGPFYLWTSCLHSSLHSPLASFSYRPPTLSTLPSTTGGLRSEHGHDPRQTADASSVLPASRRS